MAADASTFPQPASAALAESPVQLEKAWRLPDRGSIGIAFLIISESALFTIFVVAYLVYMGKSSNGPYPKDVLEVPIFSSICLLSSSATIVMAERALHHSQMSRFRFWWGLTILLGLEFLTGTGLEWNKLIYHDGLTMSTNLFGTTYYALVGLHASHVIVGMLFLCLTMTVTWFGFPIHTQERRVMFLSWYWHFVDAVWVVVFTVVYLVGR